MNRPAPRDLTVIGKTYVTPNMLRVTLGGDGIASFPDDQASAYVKLIFPIDGDEKGRVIRRTYTVRHDRITDQGRQIDIDFVMHGTGDHDAGHDAGNNADHGGPASNWAVNCTPGDTITIGGPGPKKLVDPTADWFLIVGDMTALPAISVNLETLPSDARGYAIIEIASEADMQDLTRPDNVTLEWVINPNPGTNADALPDVVAKLPWGDGRPSVWAACEFTAMKKLRDHFRGNRGLGKDDLYISSYWKLGINEDNHKVVKAEDAQTAA
ncbi:siderophore-interacting protein [Thalassospira alkalitolerans]|uniref:Siderophore-interacting protein ViuB n=1 Tax=Thalassospira alkalitolerans TaxID=1293890 RepID=A0A1Y2LDR5_9PROT|nr:siderophore-interacting protein [Thalassospira alkalitolerans]OSQ48880.1 siderophore-interacting protein ViuB [Thalassospira alkalitolerans]